MRPNTASGNVCPVDDAGSPGGGFRYAEYVRTALAAGRTDNAVFAARMMWETMEEVVGELGTMNPALSGRSVSMLARAFGDVRSAWQGWFSSVGTERVS